MVELNSWGAEDEPHRVSAALVEAVQVLQQGLAEPQILHQITQSRSVCSHGRSHLHAAERATTAGAPTGTPNRVHRQPQMFLLRWVSGPNLMRDHHHDHKISICV